MKQSWHSNEWTEGETPMLVVDPATGTVVDANPAAEALWRQPRDALLQAMVEHLVAPAAEWNAAVIPVAPLAQLGARQSGYGIAMRQPGSDAYLITIEIEEKEDTRVETRRLTWALEAYARSAKALMRAASLPEMAERVCQAIVEHHDYALAAIVLADPRPGGSIEYIASAGDAKGYLDGLQVSLDASLPEGQGPTGSAVRTGQTYVMEDSLRDPAFALWRDRAISFGIRSSTTVPFSQEGKVLGAVVVYAERPSAFGEREVRIFRGLGEELAFAMSILKNKERLEAERKARADAEAEVRAKQAEVARIARALTIGEFATTIAHEITQPIAALITNVETALRFMAPAVENMDMARAALGRALRDADRAHNVIRQTRISVAREQQPFREVDINEIVRTMLKFVGEDLAATNIAVSFDRGADIPPFRCSFVQMQQVLINLVINAKEAMQDVADRPRKLEVRTMLRDPATISVTVRDNGEGMSEDTMSHVFEPLYTSKQSGMGLGLSISRSIVEAHGGRLWCEPATPHGAMFFIDLPVSSGIGDDDGR